MKSLARGLTVRLWMVMMPTAECTGVSSTGESFSRRGPTLNCATDIGRMPTYRPLAINDTVSWMDKVATAGSGGEKPADVTAIRSTVGRSVA